MRLGLLAGSSPVRVLPRHVPTEQTFSVLSHAALDIVEEWIFRLEEHARLRVEQIRVRGCNAGSWIDLPDLDPAETAMPAEVLFGAAKKLQAVL